LGRAWNTWREIAARLRALYSTSTEARALRHWLRYQLSRGWNKWREWALTLTLTLTLTLIGGWNKWREWAEDLLHQKELMASGVGRWMHMALSRAWNTWQGDITGI